MSDSDGCGDCNFRLVFFPESAGAYKLKVTRAAPTTSFLYGLRYYRTSAPYFHITSPVGGAIVEDDGNSVILWERGGIPEIELVSIDYSLHGADGPWVVIEDSISNTGFYIWSVPDFDTTFHNCYIRIGEYSSGRVVETNDAPFSIVDVSTIAEMNRTPGRFEIAAFPNPFNSAVKITVEQTFLSVQNGQTGMSDLPIVEIFDINGRVVYRPSPSVPLPEGAGGGSFSLREKVSEGRMRVFVWQPDKSLGSGVYLVRATFGDESTSKRVVYLK